MNAISDQPRALSLVIPTWNGGARFARLLELLAGQDVEGGFELLVIDSGSRDGTPERARAAGARVLAIDQREFGHGRTRNQAIGASSGALIALLTQDALPLDAHYLAALCEPYSDPRVDAVYARQFPRPDCDPLLAERLRQWSASRSERAYQFLVAGDPAGSAERWKQLTPHQRLMACAFDNVASSVRRTSWQRQPFPERSFGEDVAFAKATLLQGGTLCFEPTARVEHSHRIDMRREFKRLYCDHRNLCELFELRSVASWKGVWQGWAWGRNFYRELLAQRPELSPGQRRYWRAYSVPYALAETLAQFLGARSNWKANESRLWSWVDARLRSGV